MSQKILFIGGLNKGLPPSGGLAAKNQIILKILKKQFSGRVKNIDISKYKSKPIYLMFLLFINCIRYNRIVISIPTPGLKKVAFLNPILKSKKITLFITGGSLHKELNSSRLKKLLRSCSCVYGQTLTFVSNIKEIDPEIKVKHLPNFKFQPIIPFHSRDFNKEVRLLFISRVHKDKGIFRCFEVLDKLIDENPETEFTLDIYGDLALTNHELEEFNNYVNSNSRVSYKKILDLRKKEGYEVLANYHFMLFLTNHPGEGFPGVVLDAMIAQVPIIASDWNYNAEIVKTEHGNIGLIVDLQSDYVQASADYITTLVNEPYKYTQVREIMEKEATKYDADKIVLQIY